jgi:hypothetical protein
MRSMFGYHQTNGEHGEICIERAGNFIGFIVNLCRAHQWAAYTRQLELIGGRGSGEPRIPISDILAVEPACPTRNGAP